MRRSIVGLVALIGLVGLVALWSDPAHAQDLDQVVESLEDQGWYIEPGAEGNSARFERLVDQADAASDEDWYFVSMAGPVDDFFADDLRDAVVPLGNVLVYFPDDEGFVNAQLASSGSEGNEHDALEPLLGDWQTVDEFMADVVDEYEDVTGGPETSTSGSGSSATSSGSGSGSATSSGSGSGSATSSGSGSGSGAGWLWFAVPIGAVGGGIWYSGRRRKKKRIAEQIETAHKIRTELISELDELANDVLVLSGPVDLSENAEAIDHYRQATETYTDISDEVPNPEELDPDDLDTLAELGTRVAHARWQMDAAEALIAGDPVPERPKVEPPPAPPKPPEPKPAPRMPQRQPRPRVPYSRSRRSTGGGLLDILIAGAGMAARSGRMGGSFRSPRPRSRSGSGWGGSARRSDGGVFGPRSGGPRSSRSSSRRRGSTTRRRRRTSTSRMRPR